MKKKRIMIVEDEMIIALGIQKSLERLGYDVAGTAASGEEAVGMALDLAPDLILMDIILSGEMDGIEAARRIRMQTDRPIIYVTANADTVTVERARDTQPYGYLNKPVNERDLMSNIDSALHKHRMERRLRESEEKYRNLVEALNDIIASTDDQGIITYISPRIRDIGGYDESEVIGKNFISFIHPDDRIRVMDLYGGSMRGESQQGVYRVVSKTGADIWLRTSGRPNFVNGQFSGVRIVLSDITAQVKTEEEIRNKNEELLAANEELQATIEELEATNEEFESQNSELVRARETLAEHEAMLAGILRVAPVGIGIITGKNLLGWTNIRVQKMTGYTGEELEGSDPRLYYENSEEPQRVLEEVRSQIRKDGTGSVETRLKRRDGSLVDVLLRAIYRDASDPAAGFVFTLLDNTEQKRAAEALRVSEEKHRYMVENVADTLWLLDLTTMRFIYNTPSSFNLLGYTPEELSRMTLADIILPENIGTVKKLIAEELELDARPDAPRERVRRFELRQIHRNGSTVWTEITAKILHDEAGGPAMALGVSHDITEKKKAAEALAESEKKYRLLADNISDSIWILDLATMKFSYNSPSSVRILGYDETESLGLTPEKVVTKESLERTLALLGEELARDGRPGVDPGRIITLELEQIHKDGHIVWTEISTKFLRNGTGAATSVLGVSRDITGRREEEARFRLQRELAQALSAAVRLDDVLRLGLDTAITGSGMDSGGLYLVDPVTGEMHLARHSGVSEVYARHVRQYPAELLREKPYREGKAIYGLFGTISPVLEKPALAEGLRGFAIIPIRHEGRVIACLTISSHDIDAVPPAARNFLETVATTIGNVIVRMEMENSLKQSEEKFRLIIENSPFPIAVVDDASGVITYSNRSLEEMLGYNNETVRTLDEWWKAAFPNTQYRKSIKDKLVRGVQDSRATGRTGQAVEADVRCADGSIKHVEIHMVYMRDLWYFIMTDLTQKKINEEMMIQTEKMLSLGGLAAGMAHEINNPLGIILQGVQGALLRLSPDVKRNREAAAKAGTDLNAVLAYLEQREIIDYLEGVRDAGMRAARIVENMLQFSRRGERVIAPVDIHALIDKTIEIASHDYDLKKKYDFKRITIRKHYGSGIPPVPCSETGIEQVILNLLKNSAQALATVRNKDFRPEIEIRTRTKGDRAFIEVSDNGPGMTDEVKRRIFEPFYTTKGAGSGTGLGLSVSNYIVTSTHDGSLSVVTGPGKGATFTIKLPLTREGPA